MLANCLMRARGFSPAALPATLDPYTNGSSTTHTRDNRLGATYSFNFDVLHRAVIQQRISAFYNAQCCGLAMEYQTYNYGAGSISPMSSSGRGIRCSIRKSA